MTQPSFGPHHASTQACAFAPRTITYRPKRPISPPTNPVTKRLGIPTSRSISAMAVENASQCPALCTKRNSSTGLSPLCGISSEYAKRVWSTLSMRRAARSGAAIGSTPERSERVNAATRSEPSGRQAGSVRPGATRSAIGGPPYVASYCRERSGSKGRRRFLTSSSSG